MPDLRPCPYCESAYINGAPAANGAFSYFCGNCTTSGPIQGDEEAAAIAWNRLRMVAEDAKEED